MIKSPHITGRMMIMPAIAGTSHTARTLWLMKEEPKPIHKENHHTG